MKAEIRLNGLYMVPLSKSAVNAYNYKFNQIKSGTNLKGSGPGSPSAKPRCNNAYESEPYRRSTVRKTPKNSWPIGGSPAKGRKNYLYWAVRVIAKPATAQSRLTGSAQLRGAGGRCQLVASALPS